MSTSSQDLLAKLPVPGPRSTDYVYDRLFFAAQDGLNADIHGFAHVKVRLSDLVAMLDREFKARVALREAGLG